MSDTLKHNYLLLSSIISISLGLMGCDAKDDVAVITDSPARIVGGHESQPSSRPYQVSLYQSYGGSWSHICGGTLIDANWVLTAAHCTHRTSANAFRVRVGVHTLSNSYEGETIEVAQKIEHPEYNSETSNNDICLLKLASPADVSQYPPALLPTTQIMDQAASAGDYVVVSGWGATREGGSGSNDLLETSVPIVSNSECQSAYRESTITDNMLCAGFRSGGKDSCQGDSGGPLVAEVGGTFYNVGVVSWGIGCARPNRYGVYAQTINYIDWIKSAIGDVEAHEIISLKNGHSVTGLSGAQDTWARYAIDVPSGATDLTVTTTGGSGDANLYVRYNAEPTLKAYDCRSYENSNEEVCTVDAPSKGRYYLFIRGDKRYSGLSLTATYHNAGSEQPIDIELTSTDTPLRVPDSNTTGVVSQIDVSSSRIATTVEVDVNVTHPWIGALRLRLECPDDTVATLHNYTGKDTANIHQTYQVRACEGQVAGGTWQLRADDKDGHNDNGTLNNWTLRITVQ